ncbi:MAG: hypothetical protein SF187_23565 [Deltaproteobacteria bacterium]|nr:hypothetical protein [Deltaproteobacteria bacterium]
MNKTAKSTDHGAKGRLARAQVASLLGVSDEEVAMMDGHQLHPTRTSSRVWQYRSDEVRAVLLQRAGLTERSSANGDPDDETAATVFALFEAKKSLPKVVMTTKKSPRTIWQLRAEYDEMRRSLLVPPRVLGQLATVLGRQVRQVDDLMPALCSALDARFEEGRVDSLEFGQVLDPATGKFRPVQPRKNPAPVSAPVQQAKPEQAGNGQHAEDGKPADALQGANDGEE